MKEIIIFIAIFLAVFSIGAAAGVYWMRQRIAIKDSQGWWNL